MQSERKQMYCNCGGLVMMVDLNKAEIIKGNVVGNIQMMEDKVL